MKKNEDAENQRSNHWSIINNYSPLATDTEVNSCFSIDYIPATIAIFSRGQRKQVAQKSHDTLSDQSSEKLIYNGKVTQSENRFLFCSVRGGIYILSTYFSKLNSVCDNFFWVSTRRLLKERNLSHQSASFCKPNLKVIRLNTHLPNSSFDLAAFSSSDFICLKQKKN